MASPARPSARYLHPTTRNRHSYLPFRVRGWMTLKIATTYASSVTWIFGTICIASRITVLSWSRGISIASPRHLGAWLLYKPRRSRPCLSFQIKILQDQTQVTYQVLERKYLRTARLLILSE